MPMGERFAATAVLPLMGKCSVVRAPETIVFPHMDKFVVVAIAGRNSAKSPAIDINFFWGTLL